MSIFLIDDTGVVLVPSSTGYFGDMHIGARYEVSGEETPALTATASQQQQPVNPPNLFRFGARPVASAGRAGNAAPAHIGRMYSRFV